MSNLSSISLTLHGPLHSLNNRRAVFYSPKEGRVVNYKRTEVRVMMDKMIWEAKQGYRAECKKQKLPYRPLTGRVMLSAWIHYRSEKNDLDDSLLCNILQAAGVIENDRQIKFKMLSKWVDRKDPRVEVSVVVCDP